MNSYGTNWIINVNLIITEPYTKYNKQTRNSTYHDRTKCIYNITAGSYSNKSSQRSVQTHGNIRLSVLYPCKDHADNSCDRWCNCCGNENGSKLLNASCCGTIKSIPAKPQNENTKTAKRKIVTREGIYFYDFAI